MTAWSVWHGSEVNSVDGPRSVIVSWLVVLIGLDIGTKGESEMFFVMKISLLHDHVRTVGGRNSVFLRKEV